MWEAVQLDMCLIGIRLLDTRAIHAYNSIEARS